MQASETKLRQLIEGTKQFVVPLFQRPYTWAEKHWKTLWNDVLEQARHGDARPHFFGSIVTTPAKSVPQGVAKYILIDGQQRITTTQILLAAIRDAAAANGDTKLRDRIDGQYLKNAYEEGDEQFKLLPTQDDRAAFRAVVQRGDPCDGRLSKCYQFFYSRVTRLDAKNLEAVHLAVVDRLSLVSITCDEHDNPHLIFESLNAKGEKLTPADLIRNFLLMRVHVGDQAKLYGNYWLPIQQSLGEGLTEFVRHYLMKEGKILKEADVYFELKDRLANATPAQTESLLRDMHRHGNYYATFVEPERQGDAAVAERLDRIRRLKVTVAYPFLLRVFDARDAGTLTHEQLLTTLDILESLLVRRSICNMPTNQLRRMLPPVFDAACGAGPSFIEGLREQLGGRRCPGDEAFAAALASEPLYSTAEKNARLRLILERLEASFDHKEPADPSKATIEHILPQTLTDEWRLELGDDADSQWSKLVHTLGNLTLSGYNPELSNLPFADKKPVLVGSHYELNRKLSEVDRWTPEAIRARGEMLAKRAVTIWEDVGRPPAAGIGDKRPTQPPAAVRFRAAQWPVRNWKDAFARLVAEFEASTPGLLLRIATEGALPAVVTRDAERLRRSKIEVGGVSINTHASAAAFQDWCRKIAELGGIRPSDYDFIQASPT